MYNDEARQLGRLHSYFLRAVVEEEARYPRPELLDLRTFLELGGYRACDIQWWVHTKETDRAELLRRVTQLLDPAERLEKAAARLARRAAQQPDDIVGRANSFALEHRADIALLTGFVAWLAERDPLAAGILFRGYAWTDSRRAHRIAQLPATEDETIELACDIVFGRFINGADVRERAWAQLAEELYDRYGEEDAPEPDPAAVFALMGEEAFDELHHYCASLRRSILELYKEVLRAVPVEVLLHSHAFWRDVINRARKSVEMRPWDFKQTLDFWNAPAQQRDAAQLKFAEQAAGFANAEGGVFFVGFTDGQRLPVEVQKLEMRMQQTSEMLHRFAPGLEGTVMEPVTFGSGSAAVQTLVIIVPQTKEVIEVRDASGRYTLNARRRASFTSRVRRSKKRRTRSQRTTSISSPGFGRGTPRHEARGEGGLGWCFGRAGGI